MRKLAEAATIGMNMTTMTTISGAPGVMRVVSIVCVCVCVRARVWVCPPPPPQQQHVEDSLLKR